jgi:hypothetical protein
MKRKELLNDRLGILSFLLVLLFSTAVLYGQEEKREVSGFNSISYALPGTLEIVQGTNESLVLKGNKDDLERIITKVEGDNLKIYTKSHSANLSDVSIFVTVINLNELSAAGSGDIRIKDVLKSTEFEMSLSGSGDLNCSRLEASGVEISLAGSGDVTIAGKVNEVEISIAGSGDVKADGLESEEAEVSIAGSGSVKVWAVKKLETSIVGSGDVYYKGNPLIDAETVGSGSTKAL